MGWSSPNSDDQICFKLIPQQPTATRCTGRKPGLAISSGGYNVDTKIEIGDVDIENVQILDRHGYRYTYECIDMTVYMVQI